MFSSFSRPAKGILCGGVVALAGCSSEQSGFVLVPFEKANQAAAQVDILEDLSRTSTNSMPDTGSATYTGYAVMTLTPSIFTDFNDVLIVGDTRLRADFSGAGAVTGTIDGFEALRGPDSDLATFTPASGEIRIGQNESLIGDDPATPGPDLEAYQWASDYEGTITVGDTGYSVDGLVGGEFLGNRVGNPTPDRATKGIVGAGLGPTFAIGTSGLPVPFTITVFGETDP